MSFSPVVFEARFNASQTSPEKPHGEARSLPGKLKIALLGYRSHPHVGGQGIYIHYLSKALADLGHSVDVISGPPYPELDARIRLIRLPSLDLYAHPQPTRALCWRHLLSFTDCYEWWSKLSGSFAEPYCFGRRVVKYFRQHKPHYDIVHDNQSLSYGLLQLQKKGHKVIATVHHPITRDRDLALQAAQTQGHRWLIRRWYSFLTMQKKVVQRLDHLITVSKQSQHDIVNAFECPVEKIAIIPNGVDVHVFQPQPHLPVIPFRIITTASSDQPLKGLSVLLRAIAKVRLHYPQLQLVVIGKLKEEGQTQRELEDLQLADCVSFVNGLSREALVAEYVQSSLAVVPSLYEGFGLPAIEAMACGVPLICSDGGALPEVVGSSARLVKAGDADALTQAITELFAQEPSRELLSQAGREHVLQQLCWEKVALKLEDYYRQCLPQITVEKNTLESF